MCIVLSVYVGYWSVGVVLVVVRRSTTTRKNAYYPSYTQVLPRVVDERGREVRAGKEAVVWCVVCCVVLTLHRGRERQRGGVLLVCGVVEELHEYSLA